MSDVRSKPQNEFVLPVLLTISFCHLLNDVIQSLIPAIYPILKEAFRLSFTQIGLISLTFQAVASLLQPLVGIYTDRRPLPYSLPMGMGFTLVGLILLSVAPTFPVILVAAALVGMGSAVFHPESSRVARMASGGRHGLAQSMFQVGGNTGSAIGPLLAAFIVLKNGQASIAWFSVVVVLAVVLLIAISRWYKQHHATKLATHIAHHNLPPNVVKRSLAILVVLTFSKNFYIASIGSYYTFYLIHKFGVTVQNAQIHLFLFLAAAAGGTIIGGWVGDRYGRKFVIWVSIVGALPFTLALPYVGLEWTGPVSMLIGFIIASAFSAILVFAQELVPGKVGMISGLFFGLAFGFAGIGAAVLGRLADYAGIEAVYHVCAFLPAIGLLTAFLPNLETAHAVRLSEELTPEVADARDAV